MTTLPNRSQFATLKIKRILCPVDFSEFSDKAYDYAYSLAQRYDAHLLVEHVVQPSSLAYSYNGFPEAATIDLDSELAATAEKRLQELAKSQAGDPLKPEMVVHRGFIADSILTYARQQNVDLIVMGTHGRRGLDRLVLGSVTEAVLRKAHCPVLAIRKPTHDFVKPGNGGRSVVLKKMLYCTDFSGHAEAAMKYAFSLAQEYNAELTLMHVLEEIPKDGSEDIVSKAQARLEALAPEDARNWCKIKTTVRIGNPYEEAIQVALEGQMDLIILGVRGRNTLDLAVFGSTTHRVLQLGPCPVLAVRS